MWLIERKQKNRKKEHKIRKKKKETTSEDKTATADGRLNVYFGALSWRFVAGNKCLWLCPVGRKN